MGKAAEAPSEHGDFGTGVDEVAMVAPKGRVSARQPITSAICVQMALATIAFAVASIIHFGVTIPLGPLTIDDPFPGAAIPEAIISIALGIGTVAVIARLPARRWMALATTLFALLATSYGLSVTAGSSRTGDITYHVTILVVLLVIAGLQIVPTGRRGLSD